MHTDVAQICQARVLEPPAIRFGWHTRAWISLGSAL